MAYRSGRNLDYVIIPNRRSKRSRHYPYDDGFDYDDDDSHLLPAARRLPRTRAYRDPHLRYLSADHIDSDYRRQRYADPYDHRPGYRRAVPHHGRVILGDDDYDDHGVKIARHNRSTSPGLTDYRRSRYHPHEARRLYYEDADGHIGTRPSRRHTFHTKKTHVLYADDEPTKVIKKVIIDPHTGDRETIYEKDRARKHEKYIVQHHPAELLYDSDEDDYDPYDSRHVRGGRHRAIPRDYLGSRRPIDAEHLHDWPTRMPAIRNTRRVVYDVPSRKPITKYLY